MSKHNLSAALCALVAACLVVACRSTPGTGPAPSADTWAVVGGEDITRQDVEKAFRRDSNAAPGLSAEETLSAQLGLLDNLIMEEILVAKARTLKIEVPESDVEAAYNQAKGNMTEEAFQQELSKRSLTPTDMRDAMRRQLITQKLITQEVGGKIVVTDQQVSDFFNANRAQFNFPEDAYHLAQIVVTPVREPQQVNASGDDAATPQAAAAKVQQLMERLKSGTSFAELARAFSEDPESAQRGGDLGLIPLSAVKQAAPTLRDAVLQMAPGNARVVSQDGAHTIVFLVAKEAAGQRDLSMPEVRQRITDGLKARQEQLLRAAYLTVARTDADVVNYQARRVVESQGKVPAPAATPAAADPPAK